MDRLISSATIASAHSARSYEVSRTPKIEGMLRVNVLPRTVSEVTPLRMRHPARALARQMTATVSAAIRAGAPCGTLTSPDRVRVTPEGQHVSTRHASPSTVINPSGNHEDQCVSGGTMMTVRSCRRSTCV